MQRYFKMLSGLEVSDWCYNVRNMLGLDILVSLAAKAAQGGA
jgi:hypothetical protein